jgi:hypothetical protein
VTVSSLVDSVFPAEHPSDASTTNTASESFPPARLWRPCHSLSKNAAPFSSASIRTKKSKPFYHSHDRSSSAFSTDQSSTHRL